MSNQQSQSKQTISVALGIILAVFILVIVLPLASCAGCAACGAGLGAVSEMNSRSTVPAVSIAAIASSVPGINRAKSVETRQPTWGTLAVYNGTGTTETPIMQLPDRPWQLRWSAKAGPYGDNFAVRSVSEHRPDLLINSIVKGEKDGIVDVHTGGPTRLEVSMSPDSWTLRVDVQDVWMTEADCNDLWAHWSEIVFAGSFLDMVHKADVKIDDEALRAMETAAHERVFLRGKQSYAQKCAVWASSNNVNAPLTIANTLRSLNGSTFAPWVVSQMELSEQQRPERTHPRGLLLAMHVQAILYRMSGAVLGHANAAKVVAPQTCTAFAIDAAFCDNHVSKVAREKLATAMKTKDPDTSCAALLATVENDPCSKLGTVKNTASKHVRQPSTVGVSPMPVNLYESNYE